MRQRGLIRYVAVVLALWLLVVMVRFPSRSGNSSGGAKVAKPEQTAVPQQARPTQQQSAEELHRGGEVPHDGAVDAIDAATEGPSQPPKKKGAGDGAQNASPKTTTNLDMVRRQQVVTALRHSWDGYRNNAFGKDEYFPIAKKTHNWGDGKGLGVTIVDALDTLLIAGMDKEAEECMAWIKEQLNFDQPTKVSVFETTIRILGGLLSAYERTGRKFLLNKAVDLGQRLLKAFDTPSGIPDNYVNLHSGAHEGAQWNGGLAILSELGSLQLEFRKLSALTGVVAFDEKATGAINKIRKHCTTGFCPRNFRGDAPMIGSSAGLGSFGDSFYEYLLKVWILSDKKDATYKDMWDRAAAHILETTTTVGALVVPNGAETGNTMEHLACFSGGLFALSYLHTKQARHLELAKQIAETCHAMYEATATKLAPDVVQVHAGSAPFVVMDPKYILRPETVETYFYLWKVTHDAKYRDWGHEVLMACNKHLKLDDGYVGSADVNRVPTPHNDNMETFWFAETLKYLYLLFSEDEAIDLNEWVFNTEAHPVKVIRNWAAKA